MAEFGKITLPGIDDLVKDLDKHGKAIQDEVDREIDASAKTIIRNAKRAAPKDQGRISQLLSERRVAKMTRELISGAEHSAFQEFGTKSKVKISHPELVAFALQFKGVRTGGRQSAKQAIYEWARRVGIPKEAWWNVFISIMKFGIKARPFFFPAYYAEIPQTRKRIENILNRTEP